MMAAKHLNFAPLVLIGGLGIIAALAASQQQQSGQDNSLMPFIFGSADSGADYTEPSIPNIFFPSVPEAVINLPSLESITGGTASGYVADSSLTKKAARDAASDPVLSLTGSAFLTPLSNFERAEFNNRLTSSIYENNRTGGGSVENAISFMSIPVIDGQMRATVDNPGINNAGSSLTLITNPDGSYQAYDWKRNIVASGSAGALAGLVSESKKATSSDSSEKSNNSNSSSTYKTSGGNTYDKSTGTTTTRTGETSSGWVSH